MEKNQRSILQTTNRINNFGLDIIVSLIRVPRVFNWNRPTESDYTESVGQQPRYTMPEECVRMLVKIGRKISSIAYVQHASILLPGRI